MSSMQDQQLYLVFDDGEFTPTITCSAGGYLTPTIRWVQESGRGLPIGISQRIQPNGDLQLRWQRAIEFIDSGTYICEASNNIGNSSATLQILVQSKRTK